MSLPALLTAVRDAIRSEFDADELGCEVTPDGRPVPMAGQVFFAVHPGDSSNSSDLSIDELFDFSVTVTCRTGVPPLDRIGTSVILSNEGPLALARRVALLIGMNYTVMAAANAIITSDFNGFIRPPVYRTIQYLGVKGPDWFFSDGEDEASGMAIQVNFNNARRVQHIEESS